MKARCHIPADLQVRLESARLDLLSLFRALDRLNLTADEIPQPELHDLFELDADFAEALCVLSQPLQGINVEAMVRDTEVSLGALTEAHKFLFQLLPEFSWQPLTALQKNIRRALTVQDAYLSIPDCDPRNC